jgi:folate-binding protein YgfZ
MNSYRYYAGKFSGPFNVYKLSGPDVVGFLQAQSTYNINELHAGYFHLTAFLDAQGRSETFGWLLREENNFLFLTPELLKEQTTERLNRFLISEDVVIAGPFSEEWTCVIGEDAHSFKDHVAFLGEMFAEKALLTRSGKNASLATIPDADVERWRALTGWPDFKGANFQKEIINNNRLFDLCVSFNKGCYPGQETVSKIATRRGAAYAPVLLEVESFTSPGEVVSFGNKIGLTSAAYEWNGRHYLTASLLRDFRVENMKISALIGEQEKLLTVKYYPLISGNSGDKAQELFYEGSDQFRRGNEQRAEECFKLALKIVPSHPDALESLGVLLGRLGRYEEAIEWMKQLSEFHPSSVMAHTNLSMFLMKLGKIEEAEEQKSFATVKSFQKFGEEAKSKEALKAEKQKKSEDWVRRESMFREVLEIDSDDTLANYGLGSIAVEKGEWDVARTHLVKVLAADPKYSVAYLALGKAYQGLGNFEEAKRAFRDGIKVAAAKGDLMPANQMQSELDRL